MLKSLTGLPGDYVNRHNLPLARHAAMDMSATGWIMIANSLNCLIAEDDSIINATFTNLVFMGISFFVFISKFITVKFCCK